LEEVKGLSPSPLSLFVRGIDLFLAGNVSFGAGGGGVKAAYSLLGGGGGGGKEAVAVAECPLLGVDEGDDILEPAAAAAAAWSGFHTLFWNNGPEGG
jgi:hypothetical protein